AAQSEVEHYTRIEFGVIDRDIEVGAHAVNDVVHLVAELLDNATSFSPPDSSVFVEARRVGDRAVLLVEDRGIGIMPEQLSELNERLSTPPTVDVAVSRMMGLVVVARLANRHGIRVELRSAPERGTIADVMLPPTVLVPRALAGRLRGGAIDMLGRGSSGQSRNPVGPPLALESGPSAGARPPEQPARAFDSGPFDRAAPYSQRSTDERGQAGPGARPAMPAWSDLTGASGSNGAGAGPLSPPPQEPLPQRRPGDSRIFDGEVMPGSPPESRANGARSSSRDEFGSPPATAPPVSSPPPAGGSRPGGAPPPAWPPPPPSADGSDNGGPPAVPGEFAAALDMTAEIPRVRGEDGVAAAEPTTGYGSAPDNRPRFVDETMELPIFRELESAWFRTRRSVPEEGASSAASPRTQPGDDRGPVSAGRGASGRTEAPAGANYQAEAAGREAAPAGVRRVPAQEHTSWESAADDGWRAATAAAESQVSDLTGAGLPKRVPMAQLVPGGVDKNASTSHRRTPEAVRGLLSAYHRGVQRGRSQPRGSAPDGGNGAEGRRPDLKTPERTTTGPQSSQAGKEQDG
ncbi:MAG TPA: ATP-binding protein, partial [Micromonosporaceae bacterium]|nr:ATP-binding protein [Micromonosporaceae bacterium]